MIPANNPNKVLVDRTELLNGIRRVAVCSNQATNLIKFEIEPNTINLTAQDLDFSVSAQESLTCDYEGEAIEIGFRSTFLVEILSNIETQNVSVELADSTRAGVFKPVYDEAPDTETLMLLMPDDDQRIKSVQDPSQAADRSAFAGASAGSRGFPKSAGATARPTVTAGPDEFRCRAVERNETGKPAQKAKLRARLSAPAGCRRSPA